MSSEYGDNRHRLQDAALELFATQGYRDTTITDIARRAGLTERTFHRLFADKREVLTADMHRLTGVLRDAMEAGPATPHVAVRHAVSALARDMAPSRAALSRRATVVNTAPELLERELLKVHEWARMLAESLVSRGETPLAAAAHAHTGLGLLWAAFEAWTADATSPDLPTLLDLAYGAVHEDGEGVSTRST